MLNTEQLENRINEKFKVLYSKVKDNKLKQIVTFDEPKNSRFEGIYVFYKNNIYYYVENERGKTIGYKTYNDIKDIEYKIFDIIIANYSLQIKNWDEKIGFRNSYYNMQLKLHAYLGKDFYHRKRNEIEPFFKNNSLE